MKRKQKKRKDWRELFDLSLWSPLSWVAIDVIDDPFIVVPAKVAGSGWWGWRWRTGGGGWDCLSFFFYFRKLSKKTLKIIFEFNRCVCDKFLLVEYRVEQEKWDWDLLVKEKYLNSIIHEDGNLSFKKGKKMETSNTLF